MEIDDGDDEGRNESASTTDSWLPILSRFQSHQKYKVWLPVSYKTRSNYSYLHLTLDLVLFTL
jgi:hypothetical protein